MANARDYGTDIRMFVNGEGPPDLDPYFTVIDGTEAVAQNVALRCYCPKGYAEGYNIDAPNDGIFLPDFLNAPMTKQTEFQVKTLVSGEARKDERVERVTVSTSLDASTQSLEVSVHGETAEGPFDLVLDVSDVTVELLEMS